MDILVEVVHGGGLCGVYSTIQENSPESRPVTRRLVVLLYDLGGGAMLKDVLCPQEAGGVLV